MKTSLKLSTLLIAGGLAFALPFASQAHPNMERGFHHAVHAKHQAKGGHGHHGAQFMRNLDLSEAQRDQIFKLRHEAAPTLREKGKEARATRMELRKLAKAEQFDEAKARALSEQAAQSGAALTFERVKLQQQIFAVLTPEQRAKAEKASQRDGKKHRHGKRPAPQADTQS